MSESEESPPGYQELARFYEAPADSRDHRWLRIDLLESGLLGSDGVCRYCFSKLSGRNGFALRGEEFRAELQKFLEDELPKRGIRDVFADPHADQIMCEYLRNRLHIVETGEAIAKRSKEDRAIDAVLLDPTLTDDDIRDLLKTTDKQLRRWSTYGILRRALDRAATS